MLTYKPQRPVPPPEGAALLTAANVAALLNTSVRTVWRYVASGKLPPPARLGRRFARWRKDDVLRWLASLTADAPGREP